MRVNDDAPGGGAAAARSILEARPEARSASGVGRHGGLSAAYGAAEEDLSGRWRVMRKDERKCEIAKLRLFLITLG